MHITRTDVSAEQDHPQISSWGNLLLAIGSSKTLIERPRGVEYMTPMGVTEEAFGPLLRPLSSTYQSAAPHHADVSWFRPQEALLYWIKTVPLRPMRPALCTVQGRISPLDYHATRFFLARCWQLPCLYHVVCWTHWLWLWDSYYIPPRLLQCG